MAGDTHSPSILRTRDSTSIQSKDSIDITGWVTLLVKN